jgi:hypothetical protein
MDEILRNNLLIREWVNGQLLPLNISLVIATGLFLWQRLAATIGDGVYVGGWRRYHETPGVRTACVLFWLFLGEAIRAGAAWAALKFGPSTAEVVAALFIVGGVMLLLACLRCAYIFTEDWAGHRYWIATVAVMAVFWILTF